jgi:uncharacterized membrane protein
MEADAQPPETRPRSNWTAGRVAAVVGGSILALIGLLLLLGGLALIAAHGFARDDDGYYTTDRERLATDSYAISSGQIDLGADPVDVAPEELLGTVRVRVEGTNGRPVFLGVGPTEDVDAYLDGVEHAVLTDFEGGDARYDLRAGGAPKRPPASEPFWVAESQGGGDRSVEWDVESGVWSIVVMNTDAEPQIEVEADVGAKVGWLIWVGLGMAIIGLLIAAAGVTLILVFGRRASRTRLSGEQAPNASA